MQEWSIDYERISDLIILYGGKIIIGLIILFLGFKITNRLVNALEKRLSKKNYDPMIISFAIPMVRISIKVLIGLTVVNFVGVETTSIVAAIGGAGFAVGLAFQGSLSNFAGGILLLVLKPFKVNDYIEVGENKGSVESISIFYTYLRTFDNKRIVIPNSSVTNSSIINYTTHDKRRIDYTIGVDYKTDIEFAKEVIREIIEKDELILNEPQPIIGLGTFGNSSINFDIKLWVSTSDYWTVYYRFNESIKKTFNKNKIEFPYPHMDVNIYKDIRKQN